MPVGAAPRPQAIAEGFTSLRHGGDEQTGRVDALALGNDRPARAVDDRHRVGIGQKGPDVKPGRGLMHAEEGKRIAVARRDDRRDLGARAMRHCRSRSPWRSRAGCR